MHAPPGRLFINPKPDRKGIDMTTLLAAKTADKLMRSRERLSHVARDVRMAEGRLLDFEAAEYIARALYATVRELDEARMSVAVMERRLAGA